MQRDTRSHAVLYLWDYFYISNVPRPGDENVWGAIERATCRIREAEVYIDAPTPADVRLRNARRMRNAIRVVSRNIDRLSAKPERWVIDRLAELEALSEQLILEMSDKVRLLVLD